MWYEWMDSDHMTHFIIFSYSLTREGVLRIFKYSLHIINISFYLFTQTLLPNLFIHFDIMSIIGVKKLRHKY